MLGFRYRWPGVLIGLLVGNGAVDGADDPEQLLATARDGNRAAIQSVRTMECRYERVPWGDTTLEEAKKWIRLDSGRFWRSGATYRLFETREHVDGNSRDYVVRDGRMLFLRKGRMPQPSLGWEAIQPVDGTGGEMWQYLLFSHWGWISPSFYTLEEILQHRHTLRSAERLPPPSNQIHVELKHDGVTRQEFWFDPKANYLVRKSVMVPAKDSSYRWEDEVIEFAEPAPGVFVPTTIETRSYLKGNLRVVVRTHITELKVNHVMPASALRLPGIAGMECIDYDRDVQFKVDADGNAVGPEKSVKVTRGAPPDASKSAPGYDSPVPSQPPTPWWVWVLIASGVVLVSGLVLGIVRRRRQAE